MAYIESGKTFNKDEHHDKMKSRMEDLDICQYSLRIPSSLHHQAKIKLAKENKSLKSVLIQALEEYIKK